MGPEYLFQLVKTLLELSAIAGAQTRLLPFLVFADGPIARAPAAGWLTPITFDLKRWWSAVIFRHRPRLWLEPRCQQAHLSLLAELASWDAAVSFEALLGQDALGRGRGRHEGRLREGTE